MGCAVLVSAECCDGRRLHFTCTVAAGRVVCTCSAWSTNTQTAMARTTVCSSRLFGYTVGRLPQLPVLFRQPGAAADRSMDGWFADCWLKCWMYDEIESSRRVRLKAVAQHTFRLVVWLVMSIVLLCAAAVECYARIEISHLSLIQQPSLNIRQSAAAASHT